MYFVARMKDNALFEALEAHEVPQNRNLLKEQTMRRSATGAQATCPHLLRRIKAIREDTGNILVVITNLHGLGASSIAAIDKDRWQVDLLFKAPKQACTIKTFVGTSANAVKTQPGTALISLRLLRYLHLSSRLGWSLAHLLALLRMNLFPYRDLMQWLDEPFATPPEPQDHPQAALVYAKYWTACRGTI